MSLKDILSPFYVWKRAFEKPYTTMKPLSERPGAPRFRGFHKNDMEKCIGCGTCEAVCQNAAIDMVPVDDIKTTREDSGLRPEIDYGRCCWCALCVDVCTTGSLTMSNEYVWIDSNPEVYRFIPGSDSKKWDKIDLGYTSNEGLNLLDKNRMKMNILDPDKRTGSFIEMVKGFSREEAIKEAERCVECGICVATCPTHMDIPEYIRAIREDDLEEALRILYKTNPLSASCGRICTHRCEDVCSIGILGDPIAIRWLKRYILDNIEDSKFKQILQDEFKLNGKKIAIIGAGPGGLSTAYYLTTAGYEVTIFESKEKAGGMMRYGIPEYRLPYNIIDKEVEYITSLGVNIKFNNGIETPEDFHKIYNNYDAVFFSTGLNKSYTIDITGEELPNVISGLDFLERITKNDIPEIGKKVAVIGGGNTAMDAARTARRLGADVEIYYRRRIDDMPADKEEIEEAMEEKVIFYAQTTPLELEKDGEQVKFIWGKNEMIFEEGKRPKPVLIKGKFYSTIIDTLIVAIGQDADYSFLPENIHEMLRFKKSKVEVNKSGQTSVEKIFAGGDISNNTVDAISAIADGHRAAKGIDRYLQKISAK